MRRLVLIGVAILGSACGSDRSPTAPSPAPAPPAAVSLSGSVSSTTGARIPSASVRILDGVNAGRSTVTNASGEYRFESLTAGNGNLAASASGYLEDRRGLTISGASTLHFTLQPAPLWSASGSGNTVLDKPAYATRLRITGRFTGFSSNFIIWCGSQLVVNELLGTGWGRTTYDGTHLTPSCTLVRVENSTGVAWTFTEVR